MGMTGGATGREALVVTSIAGLLATPPLILCSSNFLIILTSSIGAPRISWDGCTIRNGLLLVGRL
jgi:hypothetical protein